MTAPVMTEKKFDHLAYVRIFEGCNLACDHCFIPANPKKMSMDQIKNTANYLKGKVPAGSRVYLQWHGGEPTIFGPDYLESCIRMVKEGNQEAGNPYIFSFGLQTNLLNYAEHREGWKKLYGSHFNQEVGVSWDPQIRKLKTGDRQTAHERFNKIFWENLASVSGDGINPYLVITSTKTLFKHFPNPLPLLEKLVAHGVTHLHLERVTKTGEARDNWDEVGLSNMEYVSNMSRWFRYYRLWQQQRLANNLPDLHISPFDGFLESATKLQAIQDIQKDLSKQAREHILPEEQKGKGSGCWSGSCDTTFHTLDSGGYKAGCTALTSEVENKASKTGAKTIAWFRKGQTHQGLIETRQERQQSCAGCEFLPVCSSGCLSLEKFDGSGECSGGKGIFQEAMQLLGQMPDTSRQPAASSG